MFVMEQRWLSLDMIAYTLRLPKSYIKTLTKQGLLVSIGTRDQQRWLDPTPEYSEKLRMAAILHGKAEFIPPDVHELGLISLRELAEICGWTLNYARLYLKQNPKIPRLRVSNRLQLFSVRTVRDILWKRQGRIHSAQRAPFYITELVDFVRREIAEEERDTPTDAEFKADDKIQRRLERIVRRSEKDQEAAKEDLADKMELARRIVKILESAKPSSVPELRTHAPEGPEPQTACSPQCLPHCES